MLKSILLVATMVIGGTFAAIAGDKDSQLMSYSIEGAGTGTQGEYLVKVTVTDKNAKKVDETMLKKCAVHGVLFRGFSNPSARGSQRPLAGSAQAEGQHADFFKSFFGRGGTAASYANVLGGSRDVVKSGKEYKVSCLVSVNKDQLRRDLESEGVIKGLNSAF